MERHILTAPAGVPAPVEASATNTTQEGHHMTNITPSDILEGDRLLQSNGTIGWVAQGDAAITPSGMTIVLVQHIPDGGIDARLWDADTDVTFTGQVTDGIRYLTLNQPDKGGPQSAEMGTELGAAVAAAVGDTLGFSAGLRRPR